MTPEAKKERIQIISDFVGISPEEVAHNLDINKEKYAKSIRKWIQQTLMASAAWIVEISEKKQDETIQQRKAELQTQLEKAKNASMALQQELLS